MDLLIDTHVFLFWQEDDPRLGQRTRKSLGDTRNSVMASAAVPWEIAMKIRRGKLRFRGSPSAAVLASGFRLLPIEADEAELAGQHPWNHADPFDRIMVAQAICRGLVLVTADRVILACGLVPVIDATR